MTMTINPKTLRNSFLFKDVDAEVLQEVAKHCQHMELSAGDTLFEQNTAPDAMYFLEEGQIHVVRHYSDGAEVILATEVPYYVIGELSLLANQPRTGSVVAVGDCDLIKLSRDAIMQIFHQIPQVAVPALNHMGNRLYKLNLSVRENAVGNVSARVASVLLLLSDDQSGLINHPTPVIRIARATALRADVVDEMLNDWASKGVITIDDKHITINDIGQLRNLA